MKRTHYLNELNISHVDQEVSLSGFVHRRRDHGGLIFIDLRDRFGITQVTFDPEISAQAHELANTLRSEFVINIKGKVIQRPDGMQNKQLPTGEIEVAATELTILSSAKTPPFEIESQMEPGEDIRLKYRYLDLRRARLQKNIQLRHDIILNIRNFLSENKFMEIETPILIKGTPEGSREYIVPSRIYPGNFYVLPQSPQQLKQLLMVAGMDKYFQIARCFRDEDLRGDRQPEFTQLDLEMSFVDQEDVISLNTQMILDIIKTQRPDVSLRFPEPIRLTYDEAMNKYGSDKPDLRFDLEFVDVTDVFAQSEFKAFASIVSSGGVIKALKAPNSSELLSRKVISELEAKAKIYKAKGLAYIIKENGELRSPIIKFMSDSEIAAVVDAVELNDNDVVFFMADEFDIACNSLGAVRSELGKILGLIDPKEFALLWVTDFPMFEKNDDGSLQACHHPFTSPLVDDISDLKTKPLELKSISYDVVLNGYEIGGGSVRIHDPELQKALFEALGISDDQVEQRFGHMLDAFSYGVPPHAGIAWGLDRLVMILADEPNIREVIAFPKDSKAKDTMLGAPSPIDPELLDELQLNIIED